MKNKFIRPIMTLGVLMLFQTFIFAQSQVSSADVKGTITDAQKAAIAGATITVTNVATGVARATTTDSAGDYRIPLLPPGDYEIKAEAQGFTPQLKKGITLTIGQTGQIDFELQVGAVGSQVDIVATEVPVIETERTHQAATLTQRPIQNLPINGRNFLDFVLLTAGVVEENPAVSNGLLPQLSTSKLSFAGQNGRSNNVTIDGVDNNDIASNTVRPTISQEAVQEFQINRSSYGAEFGRASGGAINIVSKGGGNQFHGSIYNYLRNEKLDARNTFAAQLAKDPPFKRNQPGFTFSGPLKQDKTFFFLAYEGLFQRESSFTTILSDPTILEPTAGQKDLINTLITSGTALGGATGQALVTQGQTLAALLTTTPTSPFPNAQAPVPFNRNTYNLLARSTGSFPLVDTTSVGSVRLDHTFNSSDNLLFRYSLTNKSAHGLGVGGNKAPSAGFDFANHDHSFILGENHVFSGRAVNEFRFQFARNVFNVDTVDPFGPRINIGNFSFGRDFNNPSDRTQRRYQFLDNFSYTAGKHNLKFGGDFNRISFKVFNPIFMGGSLSFTQLPVPLGLVLGTSSATQLATLLATPRTAGGLGRADLVPVVTTQPLTLIQQFNFGLMQQFTQGFGNPNAELSLNQMSAYGQDNVQVMPGLQLNFGLRYDFEAQPQGVPRDKNNFGPRFGMAWDVFNNGKMVVRGGGGVYYQPLYSAVAFASKILGKNQQITSLFVSPLTPAVAGTPCAPPQTSAFCFFQRLVGGGLLTLPATQTIPEAAWAGLLGYTRQSSSNKVVQRVDDGAVNPYAVQGSFGFDYLLGKEWNLSLNYNVNRGVRLIRNRQVNAAPNPLAPRDAFGRVPLSARVNPTLLVDYSIETGGNSIYHGMAASLNKRFSNHYQWGLSYTWGKAIDDTVDINQNLGPQNPLNIREERSLSLFDVRHNLSAYVVFESPFKNPLTKGFILSPIVRARSGYPFNIITGVDINGDNNSNDRPFAVGRNTGQGEAFYTIDLRLGRTFNLGAEMRTLEFSIDAFNLLNHVNFKEVNGNMQGVLRLSDLNITDVRIRGSEAIPAAQFRGFTSAFDPRILQVALKLKF